ncbi:MAG: DUF4276 family protein [Treponema sp.]|nr:DUF4276 family protein [Treponema sp.]
MRNVYVVCEGQAEANFVTRVLYPQFCSKLNFIAPIILTNRDHKHGTMHKGGMVSYAKAENIILTSLKQSMKQGNGIVTTLFDFYALAKDVPGISSIYNIPNPYQKTAAIENAMKSAVPAKLQRFYYPHIQLHEFEALIFCNISLLGKKYFTNSTAPLEECLNAQPNPELINNGVNTAPSKRIFACIPNYDKVNVGVQILEETDFSILRSKCRHFDDWISFLQTL